MEIALTIIGIFVAILLAVFSEPIAAWWRKRHAEHTPRKETERAEHKSDDAKSDSTPSLSTVRPTCYCTKEGEVMVLKMYGLTGKYIYQCPKCERRIKADVPDQIY